MQTNITSNEILALQAIVKSEYQDGGNPVGHDVWTEYCNPFANKRTQSGVYSSLVKKGFIGIGRMDEAPFGTVHITQAGFDVLTAAQPKEKTTPQQCQQQQANAGICEHTTHDQQALDAALYARRMATPRTDAALAAVNKARSSGVPEFKHHDALITSHTQLELDYNEVLAALKAVHAQVSARVNSRSLTEDNVRAIANLLARVR